MNANKFTDVTLKLCFNCFEEVPSNSLEKHWEECTKNNPKSNISKQKFEVDKIDLKEKPCPKCRKTFTSYLFDNHVKYCSVNLKCKSCNKIFNKTLEYDEHIITCYLYKEINKAEDKECPYCQKILKDNLYEEHLNKCFSELEKQANNSNNMIKVEESKFPDIHPKNNYPNSNNRIANKINIDGVNDIQPPNEKWYNEINKNNTNSNHYNNIPGFHSDMVNIDDLVGLDDKNIMIDVHNNLANTYEINKNNNNNNTDKINSNNTNINDINDIVNSFVNIQINNVSQNLNVNNNNNHNNDIDHNYYDYDYDSHDVNHSYNEFEDNNHNNNHINNNNNNNNNHNNLNNNINNNNLEQDNYEDLLHLDDNVTNPLKSKYVKLLPERKVDKKFIDRFNNNNPNQCTLCMDEFQLDQLYIILPCLHLFHKSELLDWLKINKKCPVCKFEIEEGLK